MTEERAGVVVVRDGRLALIERFRDDLHYWVVPGGGIEPGETAAEGALREAYEELGVAAVIGPLRVRIDHREPDGSIQRHWYFDADLPTDTITFRGHEADDPARGTFQAVWVALDEVEPESILPAAVARLIVENGGVWPSEVVEIEEH